MKFSSKDQLSKFLFSPTRTLKATEMPSECNFGYLLGMRLHGSFAGTVGQ